MTENHKKNKITLTLFFIYFIFLTWIIIFKMETDLKDFLNVTNYRIINLKPYAYMNPIEVGLNILIFLPFGIYSSIIFNKTTTFTKILYGLFLSFLFETTQYVFAIGTSDITDLIDNTIGTIIGIILFKILNFAFEEHTDSIINTISIAIILSFIYILYKYNVI